eukprot:1156307-Pelagomonas_calceolata.AAC.4
MVLGFLLAGFWDPTEQQVPKMTRKRTPFSKEEDKVSTPTWVLCQAWASKLCQFAIQHQQRKSQELISTKFGLQGWPVPYVRIPNT